MTEPQGDSRHSHLSIRRLEGAHFLCPVLMQNDEGKVVELYLPRKCSATNRLIPATEHGSCNINVGQARCEGGW